jgi:hypothetical protein
MFFINHVHLDKIFCVHFIKSKFKIFLFRLLKKSFTFLRLEPLTIVFAINIVDQLRKFKERTREDFISESRAIVLNFISIFI